MQALDCGEVGAFIETGFFDGGADEKASVAARDEIHLGRADYVFEKGARGHQEAQHLSFYGACGKGVGRDLAGPSAGTVDDFGGVECSVDGFDPGSVAVD